MEYKTPARKLAVFFKKSRDKWKQKYQKSQNKIKVLTNKLYYQQQKQQKQEQKNQALKAENQALKVLFANMEQQYEKSKIRIQKAKNMLEKTKLFEQKIAHHHYSVGLIQMLLQLVFAGANHLRTSVRSMGIVRNLLPDIDTDVSWYSVRLWVMRLGYHELTRPKEKANDWVWIIDHSIQLGEEKCLVIVGLRLSEHGNKQRPLQHQDLTVISLDVVRQSNGMVVCRQLEQAVEKTGVPRAIIHDNGSELKKGVMQFKMLHPETASLYDIKHKIALEIKHRVEKDMQWEAFNQIAGTIDKRLQQTAYAHLAPPKLRRKARYMNLDTRVEWGQRMLKLMDEADEKDKKVYESRIGEVKNYREDIQRWCEMLAMTGKTESFSRHNWLYEGCHIKLSHELDSLSIKNSDNQLLKNDLETFIEQQSACCRQKEYLPNSSEVLESVFGRQKYLEGEHSKRGFSGLILGIGAIVSDLSATIIKKAMETVPVKKVIKWHEEVLEKTLQAHQLDISFAGKTEQKPT
jgi:hypothetical protein